MGGNASQGSSPSFLLPSGPGEPVCGSHLHPAASTSVRSPSPHSLQKTRWLVVASVTRQLAAI